MPKLLSFYVTDSGYVECRSGETLELWILILISRLILSSYPEKCMKLNQ